MEIYDISIAPGQVRDIFCSGSYVYFYSGSAGGADSTITINQDSRGQRVLLQPGQAYRMHNGETGTRWLIGNLKGEAAIVGRLVIGSGELTDNRVTGSVEVIDGGKNKVRANQAYIAVNNITAGPGLYPYHGIYNQAGSGKIVVINSINVSSSTSQIILIDEGTGDPGGTAFAFKNKNTGVASQSAVLQRTGSRAGGAVSALMIGSIPANQTFEFRMTEPLIVNPGSHVLVLAGVVDTQIGSTIQFSEEVI